MKSGLAILLLAISFSALGQINTDRPTQSFSPFVMPKGKVQAELGFLSERPNANLDTYNVTYLNALLRVGVLEWMELRITENYLGLRSDSESVNGISPTTIGAKFHFMDEDGARPQMGLLAGVTLANGQKIFKANETVQDIRILFQNSLSDKVSIAYNIGTYRSSSTNAVGLYTLTFGFSMSDKLSLFIEPYGFFADGLPADHRMNGGGTFLLNDNFQIDLSGGVGLSESSPDYFLSTGLAFIF